MPSPLLSSPLSLSKGLISPAYVFSLLLQNFAPILLCLFFFRTKILKSKSEWDFSLYQRYDQGPPMRGCENPEDKWVMSPLRYPFKDIRARCLWVPDSVEGFNILKKMVQMRFGVARRSKGYVLIFMLRTIEKRNTLLHVQWRGCACEVLRSGCRWGGRINTSLSSSYFPSSSHTFFFSSSPSH
jgi:hypothetical protein